LSIWTAPSVLRGHFAEALSFRRVWPGAGPAVPAPTTVHAKAAGAVSPD
jgi:hypothetical protein